ncbi:Signal transduction histidine kinase [Polaromonas sp. CG9_12]|nr:Signal transduction histidine kinase [Polaromonas sp. CG9_12]
MPGTGNPHNAGGQPGTLENLNDVRQQETLLKAGALQDAIFNSANFSSIATDEKGVIQIFNVGAERMLGYAAGDVVNQVTPADISDSKELVARAVTLSLEFDTPITPGFEALVFKASRGIEDIYELTYIRKDGSRFPAIVSVTALRDAHEAIIGYLLIGTDNTARKEVEAAQVALDQRTTELLRTEHALRQSQKLEALGQLTGGVAHDFNNLLAVISSSVELLRSDKLPVERRGQYLDRIFDTVGRAAKLTSQLLAFARQQPLSPEVFNVDRQVQGVIDLVRPLMGAQVQIQLEPCGGHQPV